MGTVSKNDAGKIFARVQGKEVIEYPVTAAVIETRGHPKNWYFPVVVNETPIGDDAGLIVEMKTEVKDDYVLITRTTRRKTLFEVVTGLSYEEDGQKKTIPYSGLPAKEQAYFKEKLIEHFEGRLERIVKQRYSSIDTLLSRWRNSSNPVWRREAAFVQDTLDELWGVLIKYFADLAIGRAKLPMSLDEVDALYTIPNWESMGQ